MKCLDKNWQNVDMLTLMHEMIPIMGKWLFNYLEKLDHLHNLINTR